MSDIKTECSTCGFEWVAGQSGGHSCARNLEEKNDKLTAQVAELRAALDSVLSMAKCNLSGEDYSKLIVIECSRALKESAL